MHVAEILLRARAHLGHSPAVQLACHFQQRSCGMAQHGGAAFEGIQPLDVAARRAPIEDVLLDGLQLRLKVIDHREIAVHHLVHQGIQHKA